MIRIFGVIAAVLLATCSAASAAPTSEVYIRGLGWKLSPGIELLAKERHGTLVDWYSTRAISMKLCAEKRPVSIVGHSLGANTAVALANSLPKCGVRVKSVVLWDPTVAGTVRATKGTVILSSDFRARAVSGLKVIRKPRLTHVAMTVDPGVLRLTRIALR